MYSKQIVDIMNPIFSMKTIVEFKSVLDKIQYTICLDDNFFDTIKDVLIQSNQKLGISM